jgi:arylformamidase
MDQAQLDAAYNNGNAVANSGPLLDALRARSDGFRAAHPERLNLRYGPAERNRIDYFAAAGPGPLLVFIHGGYWQSPRTKENISILAQGPLAHGIHVACIGYTLAPEARLAGIIFEVRMALSWLAGHSAAFGGDPARIFLAGWSAGGHLASFNLDHPAACGALAISGIFDLEPIQLSYINDKLRLNADEVPTLSPLHRPLSPKPLLLAYGDAELPEIQRQSREFAEVHRRAGCTGRAVALAGHNHFTILDELTQPDGQLTALVKELVRQ